MSIMASRASLFILVSLATCFLSNHGFPQQSKEERLEINGLEGIKCDLIEDHAYSCVETSRCLVKQCATSVEDEVFNNEPEPRNQCSVATGNQRIEGKCEVSTDMCCHKNDILPASSVDNTSQICENIDGYQCLPIQDCKNGEVIQDGGLEFRSSSGTLETNAVGSKCPGVTEACCKIASIENDIPEENTNNNQRQRTKPKCGIHNPKGVDFSLLNKTSNTITQFGEWPHMCYVQRMKPNSPSVRKYLCGASLVAPGMVLTAAHWVYDLNPDEILVTCGDWNTKSDDELHEKQEKNVTRVTVHPMFNEANLHNDLAILHVGTEFELDNHLGVICLPDDNNFDGYIKDQCVATGWGKDSVGDPGQYQTILQQVELPIIDNAKCQSMLRKTKLGDDFALDSSFICAGGNAGTDTCEGDGGSPLVCPLAADPDRYVQLGVVAWGIDCGVRDVPGVYASVPEGMCFIKWTANCFFGGSYADYGLDIGVCAQWLLGQKTELLNRKERYEGFLKIPISERFTQNTYDRVLELLEYVETSLQRVDDLNNACPK